MELTAAIVSAHVGRNQVSNNDLPSLIQLVYRAFASAGEVTAVPAALVPAVPVKQSVFADYLVCLEDGKTLKTLKRHLRSRHGRRPSSIAPDGVCRPITRWWRRATLPPALAGHARVASATSRRLNPWHRWFQKDAREVQRDGSGPLCCRRPHVRAACRERLIHVAAGG